MHGIHGLSRTAVMPKNCGMKGMHEDTTKKFSLPDDKDLAIQPKKENNNIKINGLGEKFDIKV